MALNFSYLGYSFFFFFLIAGLSSFLSEAQKVPAIYVFGDSLVDVGNNNHLKLSTLKANFPHNGVDYPGKKATGRFSNGRNSADFIAEKVGLPTSPPYLSLTSAANKSNAFLTGVSFASGGAGILDGSDNVFGETIALNKQIQYYSQVFGELVKELGSVQVQKHLDSSLFGIIIGSNDLLGYFKEDSSIRSKYTPQQYVDLLHSNLKDQMKRIYNLGARKLIFVGAGAIGCCPAQRLQNKTKGCNEETNYWSVKYNEGVKRLLAEMKAEVKDMVYSFFDTYRALTDFIQNPAAYGFTEVAAACCGLGDLRGKVPCLPIARYCSNRMEHVFWDLYHPTEMASQIFTRLIFNGSRQYVEPINVEQLIAA
ncbi:GDSL esterase/lipase At5g55050-like [Aristolochia californica]|uniref:GDSL esterase/lipase At5g55050-like n=1 Tax=Aristolochia californica TaxID=171875 RepID=UPI0035DD13D8